MEIIKHLGHPDEVYALLKYKVAGSATVMSKDDFDKMSDNMRRCYDFLKMTSRSFCAVIQALDGELRDAVCVFYLVLRALDTVEDDVSIPVEVKIPMLKTFHQNLLNPDWNFEESQEKDKIVLEEFPVISAEFRRMKQAYQTVISDICVRMGEGMTEYLDRPPLTLAEWDEYCHYVAGLVGIGLSRLFASSRLEDKLVGIDTRLANSMGLFLQKTNIIRDYLEDVTVGRQFWPKEVWSKYALDLPDLAKPENCKEAVQCLNELITNALQHIPDVIKYMSRLKNPSIFNFCAIPQVMAIATLERCYDNLHVFEGVVKIRKGEAVKMMLGTSNMESVKAVIKHFCLLIKSRIPSKDPSAKRTRSTLTHCLSLSKTTEAFVSSTAFLPLYVSFMMMVAAILWQYWHGIYTLSESLS